MLKKLKNKLLNNMMIGGNKKTSEKILLESFKKLQKESQKQSKKIFQLSVISSIALFNFHIFRVKKKRKYVTREVPTFIKSKHSRISLAIKFILSQKLVKFSNEFKKEILLASQEKGTGPETKNILQQRILSRKRFITASFLQNNLGFIKIKKHVK